jgi:hypothetical protein
MKRITTLLTLILCLFLTVPVHAQTPESIWITTSADSFKTGETLIVTVHAVSGTPIQGFTIQVRYDPACLRPLNAASPIAGMNGLLLPQSNGLADATFASTAPQTANGILAEVRFETLGACQTNLTLESASLAIKNEAGFAAPLAGVTVEQKIIPLTISSQRGTAQDAPLLGTPLPLGVESEASSLSSEMILVLAIIGAFILIGIFVLIRILKRNDNG